MSIQPHRVLSRIVEQVDRCDWPPLETAVFSGSFERDAVEAEIRVYVSPRNDRYASPFHFWVHALREELTARGRREDLVGAAGHGLCLQQTESSWRQELGPACPLPEGESALLIYRMLESSCRRSSMAETKAGWFAHFWGHGGQPTWRVPGRATGPST